MSIIKNYQTQFITVQTTQLRDYFSDDSYLPNITPFDTVHIVCGYGAEFHIVNKSHIVDIIQPGTSKYHRLNKLFDLADLDPNEWRTKLDNEVADYARFAADTIDFYSMYGCFYRDDLMYSVLSQVETRMDDTLTLYEMAGCPWQLLSDWMSAIDVVSNSLNNYRLEM